MNSVMLRLVPEAGSKRVAVAWLISGGDPTRWLLEIGRWEIDESELRLFIMPASSGNLSPGGLFVVAPPKITPKIPPAGAAYGKLGKAIYLPVDARITPTVSDEELAGLNRYDCLVFHPALGPIGFEEKDCLAVADLIAPLPHRQKDWETAQPGLTIQPHLLSISIRLSSLLEDLFASAATDIGSDPVSLEEKPIGADPKKLASKAWEGLQGGMLLGLSRALASLPHGAMRRTIVNHLEDLVNSKLRGHIADMQARREQALRDLLKKFETSPDEALKHALPLGQLGVPRGAAPPSAALGTNTPDFHLNLLGGGKPIDSWNVSPQMQAQLRAQYQKMVERERQLGRYRRAAYIYTKLLGNLTGAALMLREGGFFQEAAILYRDHLKSPLLAADCLADGGLVEEAVAIYREHKAWDKIAALHLRMGDEEKAREAYRSWVEQLKARNDFVQAADILRQHLQASDEAGELLKSAWPHHQQAFYCAKKYLEWRGQSGEHAEASRFLQESQAVDYDGRTELLWLDLLIQIKSSYPNRLVQNLAEDFGRIKIARKLQPIGTPSDLQQFVMRLVRLAPEDHLLRRDAHRRLDQERARRVSTTEKRIGPALRKDVPVELIREYQFPQKGVRWLQAASVGDCFYALAVGDEQDTGQDVCLVRSTFEGAQQGLHWTPPSINNSTLPALTCWSNKKHFDRVFLYQPGRAVCSGRVMPLEDGFPLPAHLLDSPVAIQEVYTTAFSLAGTLWICRGTEAGLHLSTFANERTLISDIGFDLPPPVWPYLPCLAVQENHVALSINQTLYTYDISEGLRKESGSTLEFEQPIVGLVTCPRWTKPHFAVVMSSQIAMTWLTGTHVDSYMIDTSFDQPKATITKDGLLVVLTATGGHLFDCDSKGVKASSSFSFAGEAPIAVIPGPEVRTFATLDATGGIKIYRMCGVLTS
ncbi:hypothetical protein BH09VER1_BH09VER1_35500 [soil metagenome]